MKLWIRELHDKRFGFVLGEPPLNEPLPAPRPTTRKKKTPKQRGSSGSSFIGRSITSATRSRTAQTLREAWVGDAVLGLWARGRILAEDAGDLDSEKFVRMTSNRFLSTVGDASELEAWRSVGFHQRDGLAAAFEWLDRNLDGRRFEKQEVQSPETRGRLRAARLIQASRRCFPGSWCRRRSGRERSRAGQYRMPSVGLGQACLLRRWPFCWSRSRLSNRGIQVFQFPAQLIQYFGRYPLVPLPPET